MSFLSDLAGARTATPSAGHDETVTTSWRLRELAGRVPARMALRVDELAVTYGELDALTDRLATRLLHAARVLPGSECTVGLRCNGTVAMFVASLAIARSGMTSVPIDPTASTERVTFILRDVGAALLVSDSDRDAFDIPTLSPLEDGLGGRPVEEPPAALASIVFTSGSTGMPKGIMVPREHRLDLRHWSFFSVIGPLEEGTVVGALSAGTVGFAETLVHCAVQLGLSIDAYEIRRLGLAPMERWLDESGIVGFVTVPTVVRYFLPGLDPGKVFANLKALVLTGETATWDDVRMLKAHLAPEATVYNCFGLTETNGVAVLAVNAVPADAFGPLPAGRLLGGVSVTIVDEAGQPVATGEHGEIIVEGPGCALGYWHRPALSAKTFAVLPDGRRRVRTGDRGRLLADGSLEHLGRLDHVVQVSGNRVELGEVEAALQGLAGVAAAAAVTYEDAGGNTRLRAFVVPLDATSLEPAVLRARLARWLPGYMLPDRIDVVDELPQLANGKVDRLRLAAAPSALASPSTGAPSVLAARIAGLFAEILEAGAVGPDDDFFELGGDSMRAARLFVELESRDGIVRPIALLLEASTPRRLAAVIEAGAGALGLVVPVQTGGARAPLFVVHDGTGDIFYAAKIAAHLGEDQPVYALQPALFLGVPAAEVSIEEVARRYVEEIRTFGSDGGFRLFGYSLGGLLAFEMARQLQAAGEKVGFLGLGDAEAPRSTPIRRAQGRLVELRGLPRSEAVARATRLTKGQLRHASLAAFELASGRRSRRRRTVLAALDTPGDRSTRAMYHYGSMLLQYRPSTPFTGSALLLRATDDHGRPDGGWGGFIRGPLDIRRIDGEHAALGREPCVGMVSAEIARALDRLAAA